MDGYTQGSPQRRGAEGVHLEVPRRTEPRAFETGASQGKGAQLGTIPGDQRKAGKLIAIFLVNLQILKQLLK